MKITQSLAVLLLALALPVFAVAQDAEDATEEVAEDPMDPMDVPEMEDVPDEEDVPVEEDVPEVEDVPEMEDIPVEPPEGGLTGHYFNNIDFTGFLLERVDPVIEFEVTEEDEFIPGLGRDTFTVRWSGQIEPRYTELYTLHTFSDDGVRLWVDGKLIVNNWTNHGRTENVGMISLRNGERHDVRLEWFQNNGPGTIELHWSSPSQVTEIIPPDRLEPESPVPSQRPVVYLTLVDAEATEGSPDNGRALIYRWGDVTEALTVNLLIGGDIDNGADIEEIADTIVIPAGQSAVRLNILPRNDDQPEGDETIDLEVAEGAGYTVDEQAFGAIVVHDDELPPPMPTFTITGTAAWTGDPAPIIIGAFSDEGLKNEVRRRVLIEPGLYALSNLEGGQYYVGAFADLNGNGFLDDDEPSTTHEVEGAITPLTLPPDALSIDLIIDEPPGPSATLDEGCSCRLAPATPAPSLPVTIALLAGAFVAIRRSHTP